MNKTLYAITKAGSSHPYYILAESIDNALWWADVTWPNGRRDVESVVVLDRSGVRDAESIKHQWKAK